MATVLLTGMSGTGKSTVIAELARRGFAAVDTDHGDYIEHVSVEGQAEPEPMWRHDRIAALLDEPRDGTLFLAGTVVNQDRFYPRLAAVVLLSAPLEVVLARVTSRTGNPFGWRPDERERIAEDLRAVEPLLRADATVEIDTRAPVHEVVERILALAERRGEELPGSVGAREAHVVSETSNELQLDDLGVAVGLPRPASNLDQIADVPYRAVTFRDDDLAAALERSASWLRETEAWLGESVDVSAIDLDYNNRTGSPYFEVKLLCNEEDLAGAPVVLRRHQATRS